MVVGSGARLAYAAGLLLAPDAMGKRRMAARTPGNGYARMTTRGFGSLHSNLALVSIRSAIIDRDLRLILGLNIGCDFGDLIATLLEWRKHELPAAAFVGSLALQSVGITVSSLALRGL